MKKIVLLLLLILTNLLVQAQPENAKIEQVNGKNYYVHIVEAGNTLYGIHKLYNVEIEKILDANEGMTNNLALGQKIYIPVPEGQATNNSSKTYTVLEGETLYGISKKLGCSLDELKAANPGISDGIQPGQLINIPGSKNVGEVVQTDPNPLPENEYKISFEDSLVHHTVMPHETLYSIAKRYMVTTDTIMKLNDMKNTKVKKGDVLVIPVKKVNYEVLEKDINQISSEDTIQGPENTLVRKDQYTVALLLPLMLAQNSIEMSKPLKIGQERELHPITKMSFAFYQGFVMAADSLKKAGLKVKIIVFDTKNDTAAIGELFKDDKFQKVDMVVGPLYPKNINYTAKLCKEKGINLVIPFRSDAQILDENPYVYKTVSSNMTLLDGTIDYIIKNHAHHKIFIVKPYLEADIALYDRAVARYNEKIKDVPGAMTPTIKEVSQGNTSGRELNGYVSKDTTNIFIIPSTNVKFVSGVLTRLNSVVNLNPYKKSMRVIAFGLEDWNAFDELDMMHRNKLNQHYASYRYLDYNSEMGIKFIKAFRARFGTDPDIIASQGFDVGMYFMSAMHLFGVNFDAGLEHHKMNLTQNNFQFQPVAAGSGKENKRVCIVMYKNYKLIPTQL